MTSRAQPWTRRALSASLVACAVLGTVACGGGEGRKFAPPPGIDQRDGLYKLLEINGRTWSWIKLATYSGINLPLIQYYDLTGDARLADAIRSPQDPAHFYVHDFYVRLNNLPAERRLIEELRRSKKMVPAILHSGDRRLNLAYRAISLLKLVRRGRIQ